MNMNLTYSPKPSYTAKSYKNELRVKWCPGCGDFAILNSVQKAMAELNLMPDNVAVISGIGCSSRFPYYMNTYGFHTIHGRAPAFASGAKLANPNLSVWQITGDGDALAIGGNHFIHAIRRNMGLNILLFNNRIYGLTKGQYSPTSSKGFVSKTSPYGTIENPFHPGELVLGAGGSFFARAADVEIESMTKTLVAAEKHPGASVVEILQNCVIFNNKTHGEITDKEFRQDRIVFLEHGKPMLFGKNNEKGLIWDNGLKAVVIGENGVKLEDILVHDAHCEEDALHFALARMSYPELPVALGVIRSVESAVYNELMELQNEHAKQNGKIKCFDDLVNSGETWEIK